MAELLPAAPQTAANAAAAHAYACAAAALERLSNRGKPLQTKGAPCSRACHGLASAPPWRVVLAKIRYSLAGQDTRLSPERPGLESRWRNFHCELRRKLLSHCWPGGSWQHSAVADDPAPSGWQVTPVEGQCRQRDGVAPD